MLFPSVHTPTWEYGGKLYASDVTCDSPDSVITASEHEPVKLTLPSSASARPGRRITVVQLAAGALIAIGLCELMSSTISLIQAYLLMAVTHGHAAPFDYA